MTNVEQNAPERQVGQFNSEGAVAKKHFSLWVQNKHD